MSAATSRKSAVLQAGYLLREGWTSKEWFEAPSRGDSLSAVLAFSVWSRVAVAKGDDQTGVAWNGGCPGSDRKER